MEEWDRGRGVEWVVEVVWAISGATWRSLNPPAVFLKRQKEQETLTHWLTQGKPQDK